MKKQSNQCGNPSCLERHGRLVSLLTGSQWIATGFQPSRRQGVVRNGNKHNLSLREVDSRTTRQSIVSRTTRTEYSVRFLAHSGSPRAFSPRDDKVRKPFLKLRNYAGAPRAWHGPFGLPPLWSKPVPLRLPLPPCPSSFRT